MRIALTLATLLSLAPAAMADSKPAPAPAAAAPAANTEVGSASDCARARKANKTCVLDMGGETLDGEVVKASGLDLSIATFGKHGSLIHIRKDFIAEIVKTAEDL